MVVVAVVHLEQLQIHLGEFAAAPCANPRIDLQRTVAIGLRPVVAGAACLGNDLIEARMIGWSFCLAIPAPAFIENILTLARSLAGSGSTMT